ncbi:VanZ family protein [Candidatus Woesearchaeota archaeon]|nr:VanZ family protein [Candidatus Woesearchaeota archaeon]
MKKKVIFTLIFFLYFIFLIVIIAVPGVGDFIPENVAMVKGFDKIVHFFEFLILTLILARAVDFYELKHKLLKNKFLIIVVIAVFIAVISELIQIPIPRREFSLLDLGADALGILAGVIVKWKFSKQ